MYYVKNQYIKLGKLDINIDLFDFVKNEVVPKTNIDNDSFWNSFEKIVSEFAPINKELLKERNELQEKIDAWHIENRIRKYDSIAYKNFLKSIDYLVEEPDDFEIKTENIDTNSVKIENNESNSMKIENIESNSVENENIGSDS